MRPVEIDAHAGRSPLARIPAVAKLALLVAGLAGLSLLRDPTLLATTLAGATALLVASRVPLRHTGRYYLVAAPLLVGPPASALLTDALPEATTLALRTLTAVTLALVFSTTTPMPDLLSGLARLRVPDLLLQLLAFTYRYIFLLAGELASLRDAARLRGHRLPRHVLDRDGFRDLGALLAALMRRSQVRAARFADALQARGYQGHVGFGDRM